jgi:hypothetical protein
MCLDRGDGSGESLAGLLRAGNAGSNTATDHVEVFEMALAALPPLPEKVKLVVRTDCAGCSKQFLGYLRQAGVGFSVGLPSTLMSEKRSARCPTMRGCRPAARTARCARGWGGRDH